jgi:hypothetical protein
VRRLEPAAQLGAPLTFFPVRSLPREYYRMINAGELRREARTDMEGGMIIGNFQTLVFIAESSSVAGWVRELCGRR